LYIPSAPRVNYSLLVMETAGMMKMASGDDFPLRQAAGSGLQMVFRVPEHGSRWYFEGTEACGGGVEVLGLFLGVSLFIRIFGIRITRRWAKMGPRGITTPYPLPRGGGL
jgi:hypothetical protein